MNKEKLLKIQINDSWKWEEFFPTISVYLTTYNCINGHYPFEDAVRSAKNFSEIVVVDGGSTDGTKERLEVLKKEFPNLKVYNVPINFEDPGKDGAQKAIARAMCMSEFCLQLDSDELICGDSSRWFKLAKTMPKHIDMYSLPVYEPLGDKYSLRTNDSFNIWKWRLSRNKPDITHGIPAEDRLVKEGKTFSKGGSDGCFPIHILSGKVYPSSFPNNWFSDDLNSLRKNDLENYKKTLEQIFENQPFVYHLGHTDLRNKISLYLKSWHKWWCHLYDKDPNDPKNNQYFPEVSTEDVTGEMLETKIFEILRINKTIVVDSAVKEINKLHLD